MKRYLYRLNFGNYNIDIVVLPHLATVLIPENKKNNVTATIGDKRMVLANLRINAKDLNTLTEQSKLPM